MLENYVVLDLEMTGLSPRYDRIIEIGLIKVKNHRVAEEFATLIYPGIKLPEKTTEITGITDEMLVDKVRIQDKIVDVIDFLRGEVLIGHNLQMDFAFLMQECYRCGIYSSVRMERWKGIDTLEIAKKCVPAEQSKSLLELCRHYGIEDNNHHRAVNDAYITGKLYEKLCTEYETLERETIFLPKEYSYKIKKDRMPTKRDIERLMKLRIQLGITEPDDDRISSMTQSELNRYYDKLRQQSESNI